MCHDLLVLVVVVAVLPHHLAVVLLRIHLTLDVGLQEHAQVNDVVGTTAARTGASFGGGAKPEVRKTLLVHSTSPLVGVVVLLATELISDVLFGHGALDEHEVHVGHPRGFFSIELTSLGEDALAETGRGGDFAGGELDGFAGGGGAEGGEEGNGAEHHG